MLFPMLLRLLFYCGFMFYCCLYFLSVFNLVIYGLDSVSLFKLHYENYHYAAIEFLYVYKILLLNFDYFFAIFELGFPNVL